MSREHRLIFCIWLFSQVAFGDVTTTALIENSEECECSLYVDSFLPSARALIVGPLLFCTKLNEDMVTSPQWSIQSHSRAVERVSSESGSPFTGWILTQCAEVHHIVPITWPNRAPHHHLWVVFVANPKFSKALVPIKLGFESTVMGWQDRFNDANWIPFVWVHVYVLGTLHVYGKSFGNFYIISKCFWNLEQDSDWHTYIP